MFLISTFIFANIIFKTSYWVITKTASGIYYLYKHNNLKLIKDKINNKDKFNNKDKIEDNNLLIEN